MNWSNVFALWHLIKRNDAAGSILQVKRKVRKGVPSSALHDVNKANRGLHLNNGEAARLKRVNTADTSAGHLDDTDADNSDPNGRTLKNKDKKKGKKKSTPEEPKNTPDDSWIIALENQGWIIQEGEWGFFTKEMCDDPNQDTCYALNPATPYGMMFLPMSPNEDMTGYEDARCLHGLCRNSSTTGIELSAYWRIQPGEVMLFTGNTPPESQYWSFTPYMYSRYQEPGWLPSLPSQDDINAFLSAYVSRCDVGGDTGSRCELFFGSADPLNDVRVNYTGKGDTNDNKGPAEKPIALILSWDSLGQGNVAQTLVEAQENSTFPYTINYVDYPGRISRLGVSNGSEDDFMILQRLEGVKKSKSATKYFNGEWGIRTFRLTPPESFIEEAKEFLHEPQNETLVNRTTGVLEFGDSGKKNEKKDVSHNVLVEGLEELTTKIMDAHKGRKAKLDFLSFVKDSGYECFQQGIKCQGDCRDTLYPQATYLYYLQRCNGINDTENDIYRDHELEYCQKQFRPVITEEPGDSFVVTGVIHSAANHSIYSSITLYDYPKLSSVSSFSDVNLTGSAERYLGKKHPAAPYLYVAEFRRDCSNSDKQYCSEISLDRLPNDTATVFIERMYLNPISNSGPTVEETILPHLLHFLRDEAEQDVDTMDLLNNKAMYIEAATTGEQLRSGCGIIKSISKAGIVPVVITMMYL